MREGREKEILWWGRFVKMYVLIRAGGEIVRTLLAERLYSERRKAPTVAVVRTEYAIKTCTS